MQCGRQVPTHAGGGRQPEYCSRSCQAKAYRSRHAHGTARDDLQWAALTARALAAEAEAASLREQLAALRAKLDRLPPLPPVDLDAALPPVPEPSAPALPVPIKAGSGTRRYTQTSPSAWDVYVDDVRIGSVRLLSGQYWPTLPNGFEVYLGGAAVDLDDAAGKLVMAYNGWANYWHAEHEARLTLLKPQKDGARTVRWGASVIGKVNTAAAAGYGGEGVIAVTPKDGTLRGHQGPARFDNEQQAAEALLKRWQTEHAPPWGALTTTSATS